MENLQWQKALQPLEKAVKLQPDSSAGYLQRGIVYAALQKPNQAKADFSTCIQLNPGELNALYNRGNLYFQEAKLDSATVDFEKSIAIDPNFAKAYYAIGLCYFKKNETEKACLAFNQANKLHYPGAKDALKTFVLKPKRYEKITKYCWNCVRSCFRAVYVLAI